MNDNAPLALEDVPNCPLCHGGEARKLFRVDRYGYVECGTCRLRRLTPRVAETSLQALYEGTYSDAFDGEVPPAELAEQLANPTFGYRASRLERFTRDRSIVELGCGDGNFLASMRNRGWSVRGTEFTQSGTRAARARHGIDVDVAAAGDYAPPGSEVVALYHVFEHLYDPRAVLASIHRSLKPGGLLHLQLPNARSVDARLAGKHWFGLQTPQHVHFFEPAHLERILDECGYDVRSIETFDPWHSPATVSISLKTALRAAVGRPASAVQPREPAVHAAEAPSSARDDRSGPQVFRGMKRGVVGAIDRLALVFAKAQARAGWGNIVDVVATRR